MQTTHMPLGQDKTIPPAHAYFCGVQMKQMKDNDDNSDHVVQHELLKGHDYMADLVDPTRLFINELPFEMVLTGTVNGNPIEIKGEGRGNAKEGSVMGKWTCTSGKMPLAWPTLASTLAYGFK